jgi:glycosyltransferase involved in cell wall biosynthesis
VKELDAIDGIGEVLVLADESGPRVERRGEKTTVFRTWRPDNPLSIFSLIFRLLRLRPDVVHFNINFFSMGNSRVANLIGLCLIPICRVLGFRVVTTFHYFGTGTDLEEFGVKNSCVNRLGLMLGKFLATRAHVAISLVRNLRGKPRNVVFIPHGAVNSVDNCASSGNCDCGSAILFFGFLSPNKGVEYLIKAFQRMGDPNLKLIITDSPHPRFLGYSQTLRRMADGNGSIVFVDYVPEGQLSSFFSQGDIVVFPYTSCVGTSGAFHTAAGFGKATVMADLPTFRELMEQGAGGLVFPPRDVDALVDCLRRLLSNPSLMKEIGDKNLRFARSRAWSEVARRYFRVYTECSGRA